MLVDINQLSARDLFELAQQKEREEESELNEIREQTEELKAKRHSLILTHQEAIVSINGKIEILNKARKALMEKNATELDALDSQINQCQERYEALTTPGSDIPAVYASDAPSTEIAHNTVYDAPIVENAQNDERAQEEKQKLAQAIFQTMKGRLYISDSLLREKLSLQGYRRQEIIDALNQLLKSKNIVRKGGGNYAMA